MQCTALRHLQPSAQGCLTTRQFHMSLTQKRLDAADSCQIRITPESEKHPCLELCCNCNIF